MFGLIAATVLMLILFVFFSIATPIITAATQKLQDDTISDETELAELEEYYIVLNNRINMELAGKLGLVENLENTRFVSRRGDSTALAP